MTKVGGKRLSPRDQEDAAGTDGSPGTTVKKAGSTLGTHVIRLS